jgi:hypothetical protein
VAALALPGRARRDDAGIETEIDIERRVPEAPMATA